MNPGISEEVGQTVRNIIEALKIQPLSIVLVLLIGMIMTFVFYTQQRNMDTRDNNLMQLFAAQAAIHEQWRRVFETQEATVANLVKDQKDMADKLMVCISPEVLNQVYEQQERALVRQRENLLTPMPPAPPKIDAPPQ